ncbi:hypothetical protein ACA910_004827 [Epithemia clementina (nom. ined.)]
MSGQTEEDSFSSSYQHPPHHTADQLRIAEITAKCSGALSILGSSAILWDIVWRKRETANVSNRRTTLLQILFGMSVFDIGASSMYIWGSWAIPSDYGRGSAEEKSHDNNYNDDVNFIFQPSGTVQTCRAQGFLFQTFASAIPMYNLSLAVFSYLAVNHNWKEDRFRRYQLCFHLLPLSFGSITATYGLIDDQFHPNELWCWFSGTDQSNMLKFLVYYGPLWLVFWIIVILFSLMYRHVRRREAMNKRMQFARILEAVEVSRNSMSLRLSASSHQFQQQQQHLRQSHSQSFAVPAPPVSSSDGPPPDPNTTTASTSRMATRSYSMTSAEVAAMHQRMQRQRSSTALSRFIFIQGIQFACVFILTFLFPTIVRSQQLRKDYVKFPLLFFMTLFLPLQGFLNSMVYFKLEIKSWWKLLKERVLSSVANSSIMARRSDRHNSSSPSTRGAVTVLATSTSGERIFPASRPAVSQTCTTARASSWSAQLKEDEEEENEEHGDEDFDRHGGDGDDPQEVPTNSIRELALLDEDDSLSTPPSNPQTLELLDDDAQSPIDNVECSSPPISGAPLFGSTQDDSEERNTSSCHRSPRSAPLVPPPSFAQHDSWHKVDDHGGTNKDEQLPPPRIREQDRSINLLSSTLTQAKERQQNEFSPSQRGEESQTQDDSDEQIHNSAASLMAEEQSDDAIEERGSSGPRISRPSEPGYAQQLQTISLEKR